MKHLRTSLRTLSPGLIALLTTVSLAACGDDEQGVVANVEVLIYGPNDSRPGGSCEAQGAI